MDALSFEFVSSNQDNTSILRRVRRELGANDTVTALVFLSYLLTLLAITLVISEQVRSQVGLIANIVVIVVAVTVWNRLGIPWIKRRHTNRLNRLCPDGPAHFVASDDGIEISDHLGSMRWRWQRVHRALAVPEGVLVLSGAGGCLVPSRAFSDGQATALVTFINARAASSLAATT